MISLDPENGEVWSVLVRTDDGEGIELYIDTSTGEVLRQEAESLPGVAGENPPAISAVEAIDIVLDALTDEGQIRELDLDTDRGVLVWEILARDGGLIEFYVDASNGDILKQEVDD